MAVEKFDTIVARLGHQVAIKSIALSTMEAVLLTIRIKENRYVY